jgi:3-oxoacyl-[acyl-carrier-protein] synthase-3
MIFPSMHFRNLAIESLAYELPPRHVSSSELEDRLNGAISRLKLPARSIEPLTGIAERRFWDPGTLISDVAARVARRAIDAAGIGPERIGVLINTSVCKDYLEPSMASLVHGDLGLRPECANFDIANACLGFMNGIEVAGRMIEEGLVDYALLVDGESAGEIVESTIRRLLRLDITAKDFWDNFATLTLGSVAVAMVLTNSRLSRTTHRVNGSVSLADTSQNRLCLGTAERMVTDATRLLKAGVQLAWLTWQLAASQIPRWSASGIAQFICHQVGKSHMIALCEALGIDLAKCFLTFPKHGNVGPAAVPLTLALAEEAGRVKRGDHVALMGIGSGLNVTMMSVTW